MGEAERCDRMLWSACGDLIQKVGHAFQNLAKTCCKEVTILTLDLGYEPVYTIGEDQGWKV